ncbi:MULTISPECIES: hypothetical protein [unclassified Acinetobacter]|uniref:hypothetical protein n=1 Tax=unclassified Acinetobacter TaxID=196816 RepID=UPI00244694FA|nr:MULTISPECIES: hypothetical protein [unclassified Acinetobacter]MDH0032757.1 hypothetical protein [Acinetobacter sp. GD04021]MDH0888185.1 hypothetical protein [Acinetobacter sp. GD03873]MDH1084536.1 hypothetical protein [Acinetobacter sp. GD03983]MDH2189435.1 hypothetical protein [Acinetobacter sp. GD03645]MDH2205119.1 hypothetical protein [Acinetobacter sp. GD03647]
MKKQLLICMGVLGLTACGGGDDAIYEIVDPSSKASFFSYDIATAKAGDDLTKKTYQVDKDKNFIVNYSQAPKLQTEATRNFLTKDELSQISPPQNTTGAYWVGDNAIFNDTVLEYEPYNFGNKTPFKLSYQLKKIDLSGQEIADYLDYFYTQAQRSTKVGDTTLGLIKSLTVATTDKFPNNAVCWQKQVQLSTQDYIEFYPTQALDHVSTNNTVLGAGTWQNAGWTVYQPSDTQNLADTRVLYQNKEYWGFAHAQKEVNDAQPNSVLACDFFNDTAFKSVDKVLNKVF